MGPITLFDKSFLQSLSVDESVWFDYFFLAVVCPVFYIETLADLAKKPPTWGPAEAAVSNIAEKFPEMDGSPCAFHVGLCIADLLGDHTPLDSRVPRSGGRVVKSGIIYDPAPEEAAFHRWQERQFYDVERFEAALWRRLLNELDRNEVAKTLRGLGVTGKGCKSLEEARDIARSVVNGTDKPYERLKLGILFFDVPRYLHPRIIEAWQAAGQPQLATYAPYAAFVLTAEIFFWIALAAGHISPEDPNNRTDIAYLFYLPFCMAFVSADKLHKRCAPLFMREDQDFIWGPDLKAELNKLNADLFLTLPQAQREQGLMALRVRPPAGSLVARIWDRHMRPDYRNKDDIPLDPAAQAKLIERLNAFKNQPTLDASKIRTADEPGMRSIERRISRKRGSWWQVPKDMPDQPDN